MADNIPLASEEKNNGSLSPTRFMTVVAMIVAIAGGLYGYDTGIISGALLQISAEFHLSHTEQEIVAAAILAGAVIGSVGSTSMSSKIGRRRTIMLLAALYAVGVFACAMATSALWLGIFRFILGMAVGSSTQIVPLYIAELAPSEKRGRLVTYFNISIGVGILLAAIVGFVLQTVWTWRWMVGVAGIPALLLLIGTKILPFSARWLVEQGRIVDAKEALNQVRESEQEVRQELRQIQLSHARPKKMASSWAAMMAPVVRPSVIAGLGVAAFTQLSGIEMMIYYTPTFLTMAGFAHNGALLAALGVALIYLIMTCLGKMIVDHVGRRPLALWTLPFAAIVMFALGATFQFNLGQQNHGLIVVVLLLAFMVFNSGGIQVIGWLMGSELYPMSIRDKATGAHSAMLWGANLVLTGTALSVVNMLGVGGAMVLYGLFNLIGFFFIYYLVPETAGRSLEDIEHSLHEGTFQPYRAKKNKS